MGPTSPAMASRLYRAAGFPSPQRSPSEHQLNQLEHRPDSPNLPVDETPSRARLRRQMVKAPGLRESADREIHRPCSADSSSETRRPSLFQGPPPPISASIMMSSATSSKWLYSGDVERSVGLPGIKNHGNRTSQTSDSSWRALWRRQRGLEHDIQRLLDLQAAALLAGSERALDSNSVDDGDIQSDHGSITPTGTFSSAASATRIPRSLHISPQSTLEGNVIPVRQPKRPRRMGLQAVRRRLGEILAEMGRLKREEDVLASAALSERKTLLTRISGLRSKRARICEALNALENSAEEPLAQELRKLGSEHDSLDEDIRELEEQLSRMRDRRRWLKEKMNDVKSKREAGLSGYRGALKDVDGETNALLRRPPIHPLDQEVFDHEDDSGGLEFMRLVPQRRTIEMASSWWTAEVEILEQQRARIGEEQLALEQGSIVWQEVVGLVTRFESRLRNTMRMESSPSIREDLIRSQVPLMGEVVVGLSQRMQVAESKHWNLLICAIGAECEAFKEAYDALEHTVDNAHEGVDTAVDDHSDSPATEQPETEDPVKDNVKKARDNVPAERDNDVPSDLLVSQLDYAEEASLGSKEGHAAAWQRRGSEDAIPPEFLAEHDHSRGP